MIMKNFNLISGTEEGFHYRAVVVVRENETFVSKGSSFEVSNTIERNKKDKEKINIRLKDNVWCRCNIPSSIMWYVQIHHDWKDGGRMYLLSKGEHILRHRSKI